MDIRKIRQTAGATLAYGLGYGKANQRLDRPIGHYGDEIYAAYSDVIDLEEPKEIQKASASIYFYSNMRVLSQKVGTAELYVKVREGERLEPVENHPFERLFRRPNPLFARSELMEHSVWWLGLRGNAYWYLTTDQNKNLAEIWPLPANEVKPIPGKGKIIKHYRWISNGKQMPPIPVEKVAHFRMVNPFSVIEGMSFLDALKFTLEGSDARFRWELDFFNEQRAVPEGLLSVSERTQPGDLTRIREELQQKYGGGKRRIAVGRVGQMSFQRFALTQEEMAFLQRLQYDEKLFDRVFGFPGGYWDAKANRANAESAERSLARDTVMPLLEKFAGNIEVQILDRFYEDLDANPDLCCEFEDITPEDRYQNVAEFNAYARCLKVDECRALAGYGPIGGEVGNAMYAYLDAMAELATYGLAPAPVVEEKPQPLRSDLFKWQQVACKLVARGENPADREFVSDVIPPAISAEIEARLADALSISDVKTVFSPWLGRNK